MTDRMLPHDLAAEDSVLGAMLLSPAAVDDGLRLLRPDEFFRRGNGLVFEAITTLYTGGIPVDLTTVRDQLRTTRTLDGAGGDMRLVELVEQVPSAASLPHYAAIVRRCATLRRLISATGDIQSRAYGSPEDADAVVEEAEQLVYNTRRLTEQAGVVTGLALANATFDALEQMSQERPPGVMPTGLIDLDALLRGGLWPDNLVVVGARPAVGKSALATMATLRALEAGHRTLYVTLEMGRAEIGTRLAVLLVGQTADKISLMIDGLERMATWPIALLEPPCSVARIRQEARRHRPDLIVVDQLQLLEGTSFRGDRNLEIGEYTRGLKILARELHIPVLALSSVTRGPERDNRPPSMSDLRDSGEIESHADVVILLHRVVTGRGANPKEALAIVRKQRMGPEGTVQLGFQPELARFVNAARSGEAAA